MSGYIHLAGDSVEDTTKDQASKEALLSADSEHDQWSDEQTSTRARSNLRGVVYIALVLLLVNVLVWAIAGSKLRTIYHTIQDNLDVVDTRLLPRPDVGNGVKLTAQSP
ncbi:hypothetical protein DICSQDRAFT_138497 [Dichomitus squalens LYAD-421 SS1]|uniref:Uncharacterized protein n=1 Tax=Dichomitus squalens (strain LYAD-421) TaxID=732165 RepID=R7SU00_DICSQ|nr:uncharacterized protein DICSQDRAFT_138497 [Dichomitus squalens LYAD-421 SS1]EJF59556.1 hypothetical protein DICSQDRAFT_138497 [Dichomitus squalens LYAD-421 SS1]